MLYIKIFLRTCTFRILNSKMVSSELGIEKLMFNDFLLGNNDVLGQKLQETLLISLKIAGEHHLI